MTAFETNTRLHFWLNILKLHIDIHQYFNRGNFEAIITSWIARNLMDELICHNAQRKAKRSGQQCKKFSVIGSASAKCHIHGGKTPRGIANPNFKHGRFSKSIPSQLSAQYIASLNDPTLLELREEIALTDARLSELLTKLDSGEHGKSWKKLKNLRREIVLANKAEKRESLTDQMFLIIDDQSDYGVWQDLYVLMELRRKLIESERKRLVQAKKMITAEQAMSLVAALMATIKAHVTDKDTLKRIAASFEQLTADRIVRQR